MSQQNHSFIGIIPLLIFIVFFLASGLIYRDFYALPSPIAATAGIVAGLFLFKGSLNKKLNIFLKGCGDRQILIMCFIYLLAGGFATVTKAIGSVDTIVSIGSAYISAQYMPMGIFVVASFLSFSSGTSVGSIVTLAPFIIPLAEQDGSSLGLIGGALLCGAMFGDNLSLISDTTIAATQSVGCKMNEKLKANLRLAIPAALLSIVFFLLVGMENSVRTTTAPEIVSQNWWLILPYLLVVMLSLLGINVFVSLFSGITFSGALGYFYGSFDFIGLMKTTYEGFISMNEIFLLSLFMGGLAGMVDHFGGINYLLEKITKIVIGKKTALLGIGGLVSVTNFAVANNTIAILISGKIAKNMAEKHEVKPQYTASILDIFACYIQGIIPYGAQILILISLSQHKINYSDLMKHAYYLHWLLGITLISIITSKSQKKL